MVSRSAPLRLVLRHREPAQLIIEVAELPVQDTPLIALLWTRGSQQQPNLGQ
jgi:hypothetical protein